VNKIDVLFCGWGQRWHLGTLADNGRQVIFEYSAEALKRGHEFSRLNLPLRAEAHGGFPQHLDQLPGLISDSLPDGWGRMLMDRVFTKNGFNPNTVSPLDRLSFIGKRAMGALAFVPSSPVDLAPQDLDLLQLANAVQDVIADKDTAALKQLAIVGGSPHGARPKALVQYDETKRSISTLEQAPGTPWLVKFPAEHEHKEVCAVEHLYCQLAGECGLIVPRTKLFDLDDKLAAFGIERFDRDRGMRVPVQSYAAATHRDFRSAAADYLDVLRVTFYLTSDVTQSEAAFRRCVFNVVFNNRDDHLKNFSLRMNEKLEWEFSPAYDLTFNGGPRGYHQTAVMGEALAPGRDHLLKLAADAHIAKSTAEAIIERTLAVASTMKQELGRQPGIRPQTIKLITDTVNANMARSRPAAIAVQARKANAPKRRP
jgi:serine/threonine-protein kinase HipA